MQESLLEVYQARIERLEGFIEVMQGEEAKDILTLFPGLSERDLINEAKTKIRETQALIERMGQATVQAPPPMIQKAGPEFLPDEVVATEEALAEEFDAVSVEIEEDVPESDGGTSWWEDGKDPFGGSGES